MLHEGRKHVVRRMLEAVGHPVIALVRTEVGPIRLGDLKPGKSAGSPRPRSAGSTQQLDSEVGCPGRLGTVTS